MRYRASEPDAHAWQAMRRKAQLAPPSAAALLQRLQRVLLAAASRV